MYSLRADTLWDKPLRLWFHDHYNPNLFQSRINRQLSLQQAHSITVYLEWFLGFVLGEWLLKKENLFLPLPTSYICLQQKSIASDTEISLLESIAFSMKS